MAPEPSPNGSTPAALPSPALRLQNIVAGYHGNQVLHGVTVEAANSEIVLILGPNGTGKSTLLKVASGLVRQRSGKVMLGERDVSTEPVYKRARLGIALVPEGRRIFPRQSVHDNLLLGCLAATDEKQAREEGFDWVYHLFPVLERKRSQDAATLSGGEQQMLAIAQAVMSKPSILLLDEPSAGLAPLLTKQVFERVSKLRERGLTVLMVEQVAGAMSIADRMYVLRNGEMLAEGKPEEFAGDELRSRYLRSAH